MVAVLFPAVASAQSVDQPADSSTSARLSLDQPTMGELAPAGDADWYRLAVTPGQRYDISLDAAIPEGQTQGFDTLLIVHGASGEELARNDDSDESLNSALSYRPSAAGDVFVEARGFLDDAAGAYTLRVAAAAVPPDDVGNDTSTRARLTAGRNAAGSIEEAGDADWYRLSARTDQIYRIALNGAEGAAGALADPLLRVVDREGNELASNDDSNESLNSYLEFTAAENGEVFVVAAGFSESMGAYTLRADAVRLPPDNAGNGRDTRARIALGQSINGGLDFPRDTDWFRIRLEGGQSYSFTLSSPQGERMFDPVVRVNNSAGEEIAIDDDGGDGLNSYLEFTAPASGEYFVEARAFDESAIGDYVLAARAGDIPADNTTDAVLGAEGDYREGVLSPAGDKDWFRIELAEGQAMRIAVNSAQDQGAALGDPLIVLYGPDGAEVARDDDGGEGLNAGLEYSAATGGAHYLEVRGFIEESAEGRYAIQLTPGEIGDNVETADALEPNAEPRASLIGAAGDIDWFAINLVEGRPYRINADRTDDELDPLLRLLDEKGVEIADDDDGGAGVNAYLSHTSVTGGLYYIAVSGFSDSVGHYTLRVSDTDVPGNLGTDDALDAAGDDRLGRIDLAGDLDTYRVDLEAGTRYQIELSGEGDTPLADPFLTLLGVEGQIITTDDDSGDGPDSRLIFAPETTDSYYIQASGLGGATGSYRVSVAPVAQR